MSRSSVRALLTGSVLAVLAGCASEPPSAPPLRVLAQQQAPDSSKLPIEKSAPVTPDPEKAIENYKALLRLNPDAVTRDEALRREADLKVQMQDDRGNPNRRALSEAIATYQQLLADRPNDPHNDRIWYQLARAYQNTGDTNKAIETLQSLGYRYPGSTLVGDARFRAAELLYSQGRYADAEHEYRYVLSLGKSTSYYQSAQFKYGWALFKQSKHDEALPVFFAILDRELPPGELENPEAALAAVPKDKADLASSSLHVVSLIFAAEGGGKSINEYFAKSGGEPRFYPLVYNALGGLFLEKRRYSDAAETFAAFIDRHPQHPSAPKFQTQVIAAYSDNGDAEAVVREKERYVTAYAPGAGYWAGKAPTAEVMTEVRKDYEDLGRHYQAKAQGEQKLKPGSGQADFIAAAGWYRKILDVFPNDGKRPEINLLYADSLYDGGRTAEAAQQYLQTAYGYGAHPKAGEAAYAAVQAWERLATEVPASEKNGVLRKSVDASLKLADTFPQHPQWAPVVAKAAENLYTIKALDEAITVAQRLLARQPQADPTLRRAAYGVIADTRFAQGKYPQAEAAYSDLLKLAPPNDPNHKLIVEQLAASIYKQGEAARSAGDLRTAAADFQRVGSVVPEASIRANADYDAASAFMSLKDWPKAEATLEGFRSRYPDHKLAPDADKKLALAYQNDHKPDQAAAAYLRIAGRSTEAADTRRDAAWLAASLYDQSKQPRAAAAAYEQYANAYPQPLDQALQARRRLADIAKDSGDQGRYQHWLHEIVTAEGAAAVGRNEDSRHMAGQASLELAEINAQQARAITIVQPIKRSLAQRKQATEVAVQALNQAASYGFADTTTAATYDLGNVYRDFSKALMNSERPRNLKGDELEQYNLLLEEQADPFDQKAITAYEANLQRLKQNLWNESIRKSVAALAELAPAKYGKQEQREESYDQLR